MDRPKTPITPGNSKMAFMETLLAPPALQQDQLYSKEKASELFMKGHTDIGVTVRFGGGREGREGTLATCILVTI